MLAKQRLYMKIMVGVMFAVAMVLLAATINVNAVDDGETGTANSLRIAPVRTDVTAKPGETKTVKVTVTNPADFSVTVRPVQNDFVAEGEDGTPALILDEDEFAPKHSLKRLLTPIENVTVPAKESVTVEVEIKVPTDIEAGGYYGALRFVPVDPETGSQVNLSPSVASLILLTSEGDVPERLSLTDFEVQRNGRAGNFFTSAEGLQAMVRFQNDGNIHLGPFGKLSVQKGDDVVHQVDFNDKDQRDMILPDSARRWTMPLDGVGGFGHYKVSGTFTYGSTNQTVEVNTSFWIIPLWMIIGAAVGLIVLIGVVVWFIVKRRNQKSSISLKGRRR